MDVRYVNPFIDAITHIMPQLGFQNVVRGGVKTGDQFVESKGVTILVGLTDDARGNVAYNMTEEAAMKIASIMMMGMPVTQMDEMAQSAISELTNMVTGNAATNFESLDMKVDISPPSLVVGQKFRAKLSNGKFLIIEMVVDGIVLELNVGID